MTRSFRTQRQGRQDQDVQGVPGSVASHFVQDGQEAVGAFAFCRVATQEESDERGEFGGGLGAEFDAPGGEVYESVAVVPGFDVCFQDKDNNSVTSTKHLQNTVVVRQLIEMYRDIFPEDPAEIEKEKLMLQVLEKYSKAPQGVVGNSKKAGDFRVWIYLHNKEGQPVNVAVSLF
jgi:hypothetical protein